MKKRNAVAPIVSQINVTKRSKKMIRFVTLNWNEMTTHKVNEKQYNREIDILSEIPSSKPMALLFLFLFSAAITLGIILSTVEPLLFCAK